MFTDSWHLINRHSRLTNVFPSINLIESIHATQHPVFKSRLSAHNIKQHGVDREKTEFGIPLLCSVVLWKQPTILFIVFSSFSKGFNVDCKDEKRRRARLQGTPLRSTRYDYEHVYMLRRIQGFVNSYSIVTTMHFYCFLHIENKDIHNIKYKWNILLNRYSSALCASYRLWEPLLLKMKFLQNKVQTISEN